MERDVGLKDGSASLQGASGAVPQFKSKELISLFAENMTLKIWCEAVYGFQPASKGKELCARKHKADWLSLPPELWLIIFSYLSQAELYYNVSRVCKHWSRFSRDISLWRSIDFHKLHEDLGSCADQTSENARVSRGDFEKILATFCDYVESVKMSRYVVDCRLQDPTLERLCMCTSLTKLDLGFCDEVTWHIIFKKCILLEELILEGCRKLLDCELEHIHHLRYLKKLCVSHCVFLTDKFLTFLYELPNLRNLDCDGVMNITEAGLIKFFQHQPLMEVLVLDGEDMSDDFVCYATSNLPRLIGFELSFSQTLTSRSVCSFAEKFQIERLRFRKAPEITSSSISRIFSSRQVFQLKSFEITECESMDDNALTALSMSCPHLTSFTIDWCWNISDRGICEIINNCKKLQRISLVGLFIIEGVGWLDNLEKRLPHLKFLNVSDCNRMVDEELISLVCRKRTMEVYTFYYERVSPDSVVVKSVDENQLDDNNIWICPGEKGAQVVF